MGPSLDVLVNNAGGALGADPVAEPSVADWKSMYDVNVIGTLQVTQALLPALVASGDGLLVNITSTAAHEAYVGGSGYTVTKAGVSVLTRTLRQELLGQPVRITELAPGMVATEEFGLRRFGGDQSCRDDLRRRTRPAVGVRRRQHRRWIAPLPWHMNIDLLVLKPRDQASQTQINRTQA